MYGYWWNGAWCLTPETPEEGRALTLVFGALRLERPPLRGRENLPLRAPGKVNVPDEPVVAHREDRKAIRG